MAHSQQEMQIVQGEGTSSLAEAEKSNNRNQIKPNPSNGGFYREKPRAATPQFFFSNIRAEDELKQQGVQE